ncbi:MAG: hypothetical protein GY696_02150 [Gammaproteobacteria bacterium]|nr:hypothetical protein [Gammaproteobacteria bacterium]
MLLLTQSDPSRLGGCFYLPAQLVGRVLKSQNYIPLHIYLPDGNLGQPIDFISCLSRC